MELEVFPVYTKPKSRGKKSKPTTEVQQRLNKRHAEGKLRRLLHTNFTEDDLFVTLTFDDTNLPATAEDGQRLLQNFLRRLKRRYGKLGIEMKYIYVMEYGQKHNRLHIHLVLTCGITKEELVKLWGLGSVSADTLHFDIDGLATLAKYLTKGSETDERPTWKSWSGSRNLVKPTVTERDGRLSHRKMADLCLDGGDTNYLETQFDGYEMADFTLDISQDMYGGLYLAVLLKKIPPRPNTWAVGEWLPF